MKILTRLVTAILLSVCFVFTANAVNVRVQVKSNKMIQAVSFTALNSNYAVYAGKKKILTVKQNESVTIQSADTLIELFSSKKNYGTFSKLRFAGKNINSAFTIKSLGANAKETSYYNHLEIVSRNKILHFLNVIDLEKYVEGAVAAEGGNDASPEFYKVQAILCRTYVLGHLQRHANEGFNLCDQVHCQSYNGISGNSKTIVAAITQTKNKIIVDSTANIIIAAYHNNCGGQTAAAENVWSKPLSYLQSVQDPFCRNSQHASWERKISLKDWMQYLQRKRGPVASGDAQTICDTTFCNFPEKREALLGFPNITISTRTIRDDWRFRSAYFTINQSGDSIIVNGKGFGHGVGLCQEGAIEMARCGYSCKDIINFYYKDVSIVETTPDEFLSSTQ